MADALRSVDATPQPSSACATVIRGADDGRTFPVIDISGPRAQVVADLDDALRGWGGFVCVGHSLDNALMKRMLEAAYAFFALPDHVKSKVDLVQGGGGAAWRGYMPIGGERSVSGSIEDFKEGLYCGEEHDPKNPRCLAGLPTWGQNVLPDEQLPELRGILQEYTTAVKKLGDVMMDLISLALGLPEDYIQKHVTHRDAVALVRCFHYPAQAAAVESAVESAVKAADLPSEREDESPLKMARRHPPEETRWGIGPHSDYGLWTMILTDAAGLEFRHPQHGWTRVPHIDGAFVMNVGDVLDRLTSGLYKSRHHRARNLTSRASRLSIPFFYDPNWSARMRALPIVPPDGACDDHDESREQRWSRTKISCAFDGSVEYSAFLAKKVAKVFPDLVPKQVLASLESTTAPSTRHAIVIRLKNKELTAALVDAIQVHRMRVTKHPLYKQLTVTRLRTLDLRVFMEHHVWAVYDYFQLLKRLQAHLTCVCVPWRPTADPAMRRFISEIVLEEECDVFEDGKTHGSHLELYLRAMVQAGANTAPMCSWLAKLEAMSDASGSSRMAESGAATWPCQGAALSSLLEDLGAPPAAAAHVAATMDLAQNGSIAEVAAVFTFGREDVIPTMFSALLQGEDDSGLQACTIFKYYLERHIELDGDDHGPLAIALVERLCGIDTKDECARANWMQAEKAVKHAFEMRVALWDAVLARIVTVD